MVIIQTTGGMLTGRLRRREYVRIFPLHKKVSIWFSLYVIAVFFFGLAVTASHGEPVLTSVHGLLGLVVAVLAAAQIVPSLIAALQDQLRSYNDAYANAPLSKGPVH
jgi:hypothetical protein